jgi:hypothetical protein
VPDEPQPPALLDAPCPCDTCRLREKCTREELACQSFRLYSLGQPKVRWEQAPRAPGRELYDLIFKHEAPRTSGRPRKRATTIARA